MNVSQPSPYEQVTYNVHDLYIIAEQEAENEDWETDIKFYEWTVCFIELETMNYFYFVFFFRMVDGLHRAEATPGECQYSLKW